MEPQSFGVLWENQIEHAAHKFWYHPKEQTRAYLLRREWTVSGKFNWLKQIPHNYKIFYPQEIEKKLRDILSQRDLTEMNMTLYNCINCGFNFTGDLKNKTYKTARKF